jgi:8-oxo-dGTP diphosphatase
MEVRQMATAILFNEDNVLMMRKAGSKLFNFEFWGGIGGHLEYEELNSPMKASYREIKEETDFSEAEIKDFKLKYILLEYRVEEIRQQFVYFGETEHSNFISSDEGELFWIHKNEILSLHTSKIIKFTLEHYLQNPNLDDVKVGAITVGEDELPLIQRTILKDTMVF